MFSWKHATKKGTCNTRHTEDCAYHSHVSEGFGRPSDVLHRKLYAVAGRIIERNQASTNPPLNLTLEIEQDLEDVIPGPYQATGGTFNRHEQRG
jgi:hypothetical protein